MWCSVERSWRHGVAILLWPALVTGQPATDAELHRDACAACHGDDGRGPSLEDVAIPTDRSVLAMDGVSCTVCHQLLPGDFGEHASFDGGYRVGGADGENVPVFGPFDDVDDGRLLPAGFDKASADADIAVHSRTGSAPKGAVRDAAPTRRGQ